MSYRTLAMRRLVVIGLLALGACVSPPDPAAQVRAKAWSQVLERTNVTRVSSETLRAEASTPLLRGADDMELLLLTRISGEAVRLGAERFALTFVEYDETELFGSSYGAPADGWIGNYGDLLAARAQSDYDGSLGGAVGYKDMVAVVRLLGVGEEAGREAFHAADTYETLLAARIDGKNIKARKRLRLPRISFE